MAHPNADLIARFYEAFGRLDGDAMAACYTDDVVFSDPAFGELRGEQAGAMWRMLCGRARDLTVRLASSDAGEATGSANWLADYTFRTGRHVHNDVTASFTFRDGAISEHHDSFSFWTWSRQALGPPGLLLGWTPILQSRVRAEARKGLDEFMASADYPASAPPE